LRACSSCKLSLLPATRVNIIPILVVSVAVPDIKQGALSQVADDVSPAPILAAKNDVAGESYMHPFERPILFATRDERPAYSIRITRDVLRPVKEAPQVELKRVRQAILLASPMSSGVTSG